jgi:hypothetical protein
VAIHGVAMQAPNSITSIQKPMKAVRLLRNSYQARDIPEAKRVLRPGSAGA